ncbi:hypothetical protein DSC45_28150 [Streptomyces sp. YIM 130001]|uniref:hypothetical protein n=1 Tax=Streptomyces sp. YIM 130001 TaxID=2259644 RepID=UPI000EE922F2|nr:hypothetical protein [Streptomyces sp. YIM 130001]RII11788.1 hypothetical protein DSC45_28150 [Streptomyces sp. YIM 130001]
MERTKSRTRSGVRRGVAGLAGGLLVLGSLSVPAYAGVAEGPDPSPSATASGLGHKSNAELLAACEVPPEHDPAIINTVHQVALDHQVTDKVMLAAFEAGWVESHMHNLNCGDSDSLGVFQQRPSQGWGTPEQIMDPVYATTKFLEQAIPNDQKNPGYTAGELAQSVQRSAYPERYDQSEAKARELLAAAKQSTKSDASD